MFINMQKGFTLIETIIYMALLAFIMGAGITAAYYLIDSSAKGKSDTNTIAEAEFLMRKIDWAMTGAESVDSGQMKIVRGGTEIKFDTNSGRVRISINGNSPIELTSSSTKVTGLEFISIPTSPAGMTASSTIDGKHFEITKYLRK